MAYRDEPPRQIQWEHKVVETIPHTTGFGVHGFDRHAIERALAELGEEGWELVNTAGYDRDGDTLQLLLFLKRPKL